MLKLYKKRLPEKKLLTAYHEKRLHEFHFLLVAWESVEIFISSLYFSPDG